MNGPTSFLPIEHLQADNLVAASDVLPRIRSGDLGAAVVRGVYSADALSGLRAQLEDNTPGFLKTEFPEAFKASFYGINLNLSKPDLTGYFAAERDFRAALDSFPPASVPLTERVTGILSQLDEMRPYLAAPGPDPDDRHFFTTIRSHRTGGYIPAHFDNEQAMRPSYRYVDAQIQPDIYSFVLCLSAPDAGGALEVFDIRSDQQDIRNDDRGRRRPNLEDAESVKIHLQPGELVVVHSSRYLHQVTPVEGPNTRWSACSFIALSKDGSRAYCWG